LKIKNKKKQLNFEQIIIKNKKGHLGENEYSILLDLLWPFCFVPVSVNKIKKQQQKVIE